MLVAVGVDEPVPGLPVVSQRLLGLARRAQHGRQADQRRVGQVGREADGLAPVQDLPAQFLGPGEFAHRPPVVDQVGGGPERIGVVQAEVVAVALDDILALLQRVPVVARPCAAPPRSPCGR